MKQKILTFYLGETLFGIDIKMVKEISRRVEFSSIPDAHPAIVGLLNLRGQVVTLFDLSYILKNKTCFTDNKGGLPCIILKAQGNHNEQVGFIMSRAGEVLEISEEDWEKPPANLQLSKESYIDSVAKLDGDLLMLIKPQHIFAPENFQQEKEIKTS